MLVTRESVRKSGSRTVVVEVVWEHHAQCCGLGTCNTPTDWFVATRQVRHEKGQPWAEFQSAVQCAMIDLVQTGAFEGQSLNTLLWSSFPADVESAQAYEARLWRNVPLPGLEAF